MVYAVVVAAGESRRMGVPKQLLPFGGRTVLQTVLDRLLSSRVDGIVVVLGFRAEQIRSTLSDIPVQVVINSDFKMGMLSSVQAGVSALPSSATAALICLGDQPWISPGLVNRLIDEHHRSQSGIVIPTFDGRRGHPALVGIRHRDEILGLSGGPGLKALMRGHPEDTLEVKVQEREILDDLDTPEDYLRAFNQGTDVI